jgi:NAD(P)-dependent dehydrogenase (short-subunit alcohol dehydrogenase family)
MNNTVLVTGASMGFGMEIALTLAARGFTVYASMRNLDRREVLEAEMTRRALQLRIIQIDVTDQDNVQAAVAQIVAETGGIYGVVNNAGQFLRGYFEDLTDQEIRQVFETNFFGTLAVVRAALPHMRRARRGRVVVISSIAGRVGAPSGSAYSASRFAQEGFAEALRQELDPLGVYVALIEPGITKTESWTIDRGVAAGARDRRSPYYQAFHRAEQLFDRTMKSSPITPLDVAHCVHTILSTARPRLRYMVGPRARLVVALRRYLPGQLFERLYFDEVMRRIAGTSVPR